MLRDGLKHRPRLTGNQCCHCYYDYYCYTVQPLVLVSYSGGSVFCSFAGRGNKAPHQHRHSRTFTVCHSLPLKQYKSHMDVLCQHTCACAVGRAKGIFVSLLFASFSSFFFFVFNLNKVCSGPHLRDFLTPFQKLTGLLSLSCN